MPVITFPSAASTTQDLVKANDATADIRKGLRLIVAAGPTTIPNPTGNVMVDAQGKVTPPAGLTGLGSLDPKGIELDAKTELDEIPIYNSEDPGRSDIIKVARSLTVTTYDPWRQIVQSIVQGADYSKVALDPTSKTYTLDAPAIPVHKEWRLFVLVYDVSQISGGALVDVRWYPKAKLAEMPKETIAKKGGVSLDLKFSLSTDLDLGTSCRRILGGPGLPDLTDTLGYAQAA